MWIVTNKKSAIFKNQWQLLITTQQGVDILYIAFITILYLKLILKILFCFRDSTCAMRMVGVGGSLARWGPCSVSAWGCVTGPGGSPAPPPVTAWATPPEQRKLGGRAAETHYFSNKTNMILFLYNPTFLWLPLTLKLSIRWFEVQTTCSFAFKTINSTIQ